MNTGFWWESQKERDHQEDPNVDGMIILSCVSDYTQDLN
jgi:hypothetical protein